MSLSLVSKAVSEIFRECLWRSLTIEIDTGKLGRVPRSLFFPSFTTIERPLNYTREIHFSSEITSPGEGQYAHCHHKCTCRVEGGAGSGEDVTDASMDDIAGESHDLHERRASHSKCFDNPYKGASFVLSQLPDNTLPA